METLKNLVSKKQLKSANLSGNETVENINLWAKGQQNHKSNKYRRIFNENGEQTEYLLKTTDKQKKVVYYLDEK
jgi:hypothetical protein